LGSSLKQIEYNWSLLACRIGPIVLLIAINSMLIHLWFRERIITLTWACAHMLFAVLPYRWGRPRTLQSTVWINETSPATPPLTGWIYNVRSLNTPCSQESQVVRPLRHSTIAIACHSHVALPSQVSLMRPELAACCINPKE
jgi:hypothetical protein